MHAWRLAACLPAFLLSGTSGWQQVSCDSSSPSHLVVRWVVALPPLEE
jgi:hypothetical protein